MNYRIKANISSVALLNTANMCKKDVFFLSGTGDVLNLKSELNRMVFLYLGQNNFPSQDSVIEVFCNEDRQLLEDFLEI